MATHIDKIFRQYGVRDFGQDLMETVPDEKVEELRCEAFKALDDLTQQFGKQEKGTLEALFYFMLLEYFNTRGAVAL